MIDKRLGSSPGWEMIWPRGCRPRSVPGWCLEILSGEGHEICRDVRDYPCPKHQAGSSPFR